MAAVDATNLHKVLCGMGGMGEQKYMDLLRQVETENNQGNGGGVLASESRWF